MPGCLGVSLNFWLVYQRRLFHAGPGLVAKHQEKLLVQQGRLEEHRRRGSTEDTDDDFNSGEKP